MKKIFQKIILWIYIKIHSILINISIALYNTETEILKANPDDLDESKKKTTRKLHHNPLLEKFYVGQRDEKYVQDYYELLKKADKFIRTANIQERLSAIDKHMRHLYDQKNDEKDQYGRRYNYIGFYDESHKHAGKTIGEVYEIEMKERRTNDDDLELIYILNNKPIEVGLSKIFNVIQKNKKNDDEYEMEMLLKQSKKFEFPLKIIRNNENILNKIEEITEFLHIKKIGFEYRQLEFFIPLKFKINELTEDSQTFKELIDINEVYFKDEYGVLNGFTILKYTKRIIHNNLYEVLKFECFQMENKILN